MLNRPPPSLLSRLLLSAAFTCPGDGGVSVCLRSPSLRGWSEAETGFTLNVDVILKPSENSAHLRGIFSRLCSANLWPEDSQRGQGVTIYTVIL